MKIEIKALRPKQSKVAFAYSSKERMNLSEVTIAPILADQGFDLYWVDGSASEAGRDLPFNYKNAEQLSEIHLGVRGGADAAIVYSLSLLLEKGYDYIGLIENDVRLDAGWFSKLFSLFEQGKKDGLKVGAVSARCIGDRIHVPRDGYALMSNVGAGMILLTREAVVAVLDRFRTGSYGEISFLFNHYTGKPCSIPWQVDLPEDKQLPKWYYAADWFFETSMLPEGLATLALTPGMARNIDVDFSGHSLQEATKADPAFDWPALCQWMHEKSSRKDLDPVRAIIPNYDPVFKHWRALPHHMIKALPDAFQGAWKIVWSQFSGPFAFFVKEAGCRLSLKLHGMSLGLLLDNKNQALALAVKTSFGNAVLNVPPKDGLQWAYFRCDHSGALHS